MSERQQEIERRLGMVRVGSARAVRLLAAATDGEELVAVLGGMWRRRGWLAGATPEALHLARKPRLGRGEELRLPWSALTETRSGPSRIDLAFADGPLVALSFAGPNEELAALTAFLRDRPGHGRPDTTVEELRELARRKLGRTLAYGHGLAIEALVDRLGPGERVERLALAQRTFEGLLALTDRRLLLYSGAVRRTHDHEWELPRARIADARADGDALVLVTAEGEEVRLAHVLPPERAEELAVVLRARGGGGSEPEPEPGRTP